ncbi:MAG: putative Holliday junction resolvase [Syntrophorhabdaceae bacterium PtaU1.Bin034]|jgi:putative Holliday junction resolvase|nr:MAG: putative Holliday junction resolvase [Syntrophorhabdaceae bacterium PtaU1.Bin034]
MLPFTVRVLGLDVGEKRIGIALSDAGGKIAQGLKLYTTTGSQSKDIAAIKEVVQQFEVSRIVVGLPKNLDGSLGPKAQLIEQFAESIRRATGLPVDLWDERFTTDEAHRIFDMASIRRKKRRGMIDIMAAQIILQGYLDAQDRG